MNISNNIRFVSTEEKIENAMLRLLKRKRYDKIFVKDICKEACINRSSFYTHYLDINDLMFKYENKIFKKVEKIFENKEISHENFVRFFQFIRDNKDFYKAFSQSNQVRNFYQRDMHKFFKPIMQNMSRKENLLYTPEEMNYHFNFFGGGLKTVCMLWLADDCKQSPEDMAKILYDEYHRTIYSEK